MLNAIITESHNRLHFYRSQTNNHRQQAFNQINDNDAKQLHDTIYRTSTSYRHQRRIELEQKLLTTRSYKDHESSSNDWVKNLSDRQLTAIEIQVLNKGMNFNTKDANQLDFIAELEAYLTTNNNINADAKDDIRHQVTNGLLHHRTETKLNKSETEALRNLKNDKTIIILPADKGRTTVVMNRTDYIAKATSLLNDNDGTYIELDSDPTKKTTTRINSQLKKLKDQDKLDSTTYYRIRSNDANIAKFYGLPKIHKPHIPLRPIVSLPGSPTYKLAKHLSEILKPLTKSSDHSVSNTKEFLSRIENLKVKPDETMTSFDVVSLFTSIPLHVAKTTTEKLLRQDPSWKEHTNFEIEDIMRLLELCLTTDFTFEGRFYRQTKGTPMGSPLSSFLAEAVLQELESNAVDNNDAIGMWERYVDDVFATVKTNEIDNVLHSINNTTDNITFTVEHEHNNKLAFLDVLLTKNDNGTVNTQVYRKGTHTDQILNYNSNHPTAHKISCIKTLFKRIDTHCNTQQSKQDERTYLYKTFRKNNYPTKFINRFTKHQRQTQPNNHSTDETETGNPRAVLPYINTVSEITARLLKQHNVDVAHKPTNKLRTTFTGHKDKTELTQRRNAIYTFTCNDCTQQYIGETSKKVDTRLQEHRNAMKRHDPLSLPANHADKQNHTFNLTETKILGYAKTKHARLFKEAWHSTDKETFNRHIEIPTIYQQLRRHKDKHGRNTKDVPQPNTTPQSTTDFTVTNTNQMTNTLPTQPTSHADNNQPLLRRSERLATRRLRNKDNVLKTDTVVNNRHHF